MYRLLAGILGVALTSAVFGMLPASAIDRHSYDCKKTLLTTDSWGADLRKTGIKCAEVGRSIKVNAYTNFTLSPGVSSTTPWVYASSPMGSWVWGSNKNAYAWEINGPYFKSISLD